MNTEKEALAATATTTVTTTTTVAADETADWKTYTSEKYGFSVKYPKDWTVVDSIDNNVSFSSAETTAKLHGLTVTYYSTAQEDDSNVSKIAKTIADLTNDPIRSKVAKITFAGGEAYEDIVAGMTSSYEILAGNNNHVYSLYFNAETKDALTATQKLIISNFTFTK